MSLLASDSPLISQQLRSLVKRYLYKFFRVIISSSAHLKMSYFSGLFGRKRNSLSTTYPNEEKPSNITESTSAADTSSPAQEEPKEAVDSISTGGPTGFKVVTDHKNATLEYRPNSTCRNSLADFSSK
jgi:hypothetical protein